MQRILGSAGMLGTGACLLALLVDPVFGQEVPAEAGETAGPVAPVEGIRLQLNKLEMAANACNAFIVVDNQSRSPLKELKIDVYLFNKEGVILKGLALQFSDVGAAKEMVFPFELPDVECNEIGRLLLNKVLTCNDASGNAVEGCDQLLAASSLAAAAFSK